MWTHVNGNIRIDAYSSNKYEEIKKIKDILGDIVKYEDDNYYTILPCGREGSLQYIINEEGDGDEYPTFSITIFGDLRHYSDFDRIKEWFIDIIETLYVRDAIISAKTNCGDTLIMSIGYDEDFNIIPKVILDVRRKEAE